jgi:hypothetical protein
MTEAAGRCRLGTALSVCMEQNELGAAELKLRSQERDGTLNQEQEKYQGVR